MERVEGIEPSQLAWKANVLPLNYTRRQISNRIYYSTSFSGKIKSGNLKKRKKHILSALPERRRRPAGQCFPGTLFHGTPMRQWKEWVSGAPFPVRLYAAAEKERFPVRFSSRINHFRRRKRGVPERFPTRNKGFSENPA